MNSNISRNNVPKQLVLRAITCNALKPNILFCQIFLPLSTTTHKIHFIKDNFHSNYFLTKKKNLFLCMYLLWFGKVTQKQATVSTEETLKRHSGHTIVLLTCLLVEKPYWISEVYIWIWRLTRGPFVWISSKTKKKTLCCFPETWFFPLSDWNGLQLINGLKSPSTQ